MEYNVFCPKCFHVSRLSAMVDNNTGTIIRLCEECGHVSTTALEHSGPLPNRNTPSAAEMSTVNSSTERGDFQQQALNLHRRKNHEGIEQLQGRTFGQQESNDISSCPICMEPWTDCGDHQICSLACGHMFGRLCIVKWLQQQNEETLRRCPQCNKEANMEDVRILFGPIVNEGVLVGKEIRSLRRENDLLKTKNKTLTSEFCNEVKTKNKTSSFEVWMEEFEAQRAGARLQLLVDARDRLKAKNATLLKELKERKIHSLGHENDLLKAEKEKLESQIQELRLQHLAVVRDRDGMTSYSTLQDPAAMMRNY